VFVLSNSPDTIYDYTTISYHKLLYRLFTKRENFLLCGGEQVYKLLIPFAANAIISKLHTDAFGDIYMPNFDGYWQTDNIQKGKKFDIWYSSRVKYNSK
jgi:dihydrofolate reductase